MEEGSVNIKELRGMLKVYVDGCFSDLVMRKGSDGSLIDRNDRVMVSFLHSMCFGSHFPKDACEDNEEVQGIIVLQRCAFITLLFCYFSLYSCSAETLLSSMLLRPMYMQPQPQKVQSERIFR